MIAIEGLTIVQGNFRLDDVTFSVPGGAYAVLMGRTGSGKTTILEAIAGLRPVRAGRIVLAGRDVTERTPAERELGYVPQDAALFRHLTVYRNLSFALELRGFAESEIDRRVRELAGWLKIDKLLERWPAKLSGGEAQRVALGRALAFGPKLLLLDEPLASLDEETRAELVEVLQSLRSRREVTVLHITHSSGEAELLGDVRLRLVDGRII
jgi:molybdate/tungstate transport system ATP-binding protein